MAEAESIVNDRPIVPVYDDPQHPSVLRPNDLLLLGPDDEPLEQDIQLRKRLKKRWKQALHIANIFWKRWIQEYLPTLQQTRKWFKPHRNLVVGDLVLISRSKSPRGERPLCVITETFPGTDGLLGQVSVKTFNGVARRAVRSLCLLDGAEA